MEGNGSQNRLEEETSPSKKIIVCGNTTFNLEEELTASSVTIKALLEDGCSEIRLPNITHQIMAVVIDFCKKNAATTGLDKAWEDEFLETHMAEISNLLLAADYLKIDSLMALACRGIADMIKDMTPEEVRETLHIENDIPPEEEEEHRRRYAWAFE